MIDRRLLTLVPGTFHHVILVVVWQVVGLAANICLVWGVATVLASSITGTAVSLAVCVMLIAIAGVGKCISSYGCGGERVRASQDVKRTLRNRIFEKMLRLGPTFNTKVSTAEVVQLSVEGCEQLETYFGRYLPQLFYAMIAPLILFAMIAPMDLATAVVLLVFVPLIPLTTVAVQKIAKRILSQYWDQYTQLGDSFLENLQGLTTLKIYEADAARHRAMNHEAEHFRIVTMKVLTMQLNSIIVMDVVALGGAAAGISVAIGQLQASTITLQQALIIVLLSADFFLPMRQLGSYFHVAMNGIAASQKIFKLLELLEPEEKKELPAPGSVPRFEQVSFAYDGKRDVIHGVTLRVAEKGITAIVGASGSGKSTLAALAAGKLSSFRGSICFGDKDLSGLNQAACAKHLTYVGANAYLFSGTVRDNLLMGNPNASDQELWEALDAANLSGFLRTQEGLDTKLEEEGNNLSGGQRQRLAFARAWLHDSSVYVFDEATSNIDVESEAVLLDSIYRLAQDHAVVLISHRLANVVDAQNIYVLDKGYLIESGTHQELFDIHGVYARLWKTQQGLEAYGRGEICEET